MSQYTITLTDDQEALLQYAVSNYNPVPEGGTPLDSTGMATSLLVSKLGDISASKRQDDINLLISEYDSGNESQKQTILGAAQGATKVK
jgi:hypothetical protein